MKYWCYIAKSRGADRINEAKWSEWLQREIESFEVPAELVGKPNGHGDAIEEQLAPVQIQPNSLTEDLHLPASVSEDLDQARFLIVLCTPASARCPFVSQVITHFQQSGKENRILAIILSGEPGDETRECFPPELIQTVEPIAADFRALEGPEELGSVLKSQILLNPIKNCSKQDEVFERLFAAFVSS